MGSVNRSASWIAEYAAARVALAHGRVESRPPLRLSLDVLAQHCVTLALGGGFEPRQLLAEVAPAMLKAQKLILEPLSDDEQTVFTRLLRQLVTKNNDLSRAPSDGVS